MASSRRSVWIFYDLVRKTPRASPLPPGYVERCWQSGDEDRLPRLLGEAFGPRRSTYAALQEFWRKYPGIAPDGIVVVENARGEAVATASARIDPSTPGRGAVHLVAVRTDHRCRGLGAWVTLTALQRLAARGVTYAVLATREERLPAIRVYLRIGWKPLIEDAASEELWSEVRRALAELPPSARPEQR